MPNPDPKTDHLKGTQHQPADESRGSLDKRKLTVRLYPAERNQVEALAQQHGLKVGEVARKLMEYALANVDDVNFD
ncbi:hypothetical protein D0962_37200 [Leptolyngbyaceae cyanobacterium CCMR0082]|uniref:Ribbon-helix-helix protein CopG domain-containing protein n=1 Tax=Adonisia turfae CCMR0082 TaxID=2304604 RepID=A0A6M0SJ72_9CYAN|nr:hypothetical protein [Adonisia turfae]NEZ68306.1 hypothetical protein [Adonisia turfae CCMR0082]